jgi:hypothetical protein
MSSPYAPSYLYNTTGLYVLQYDVAPPSDSFPYIIVIVCSVVALLIVVGVIVYFVKKQKEEEQYTVIQ